MTLTEWFVNGNTGESSKTLALWLAEGKRANRVSYPFDPADFNRCVRLLESVPVLRANLHTLPQLSKEWAALYDNWSILEETLRKEIEGGFTAQETYRLMRQILESVGK